MDLRKLKTLIDLVSDSNVSELEITEAEGKVRIVKSGPSQAMQVAQPVVSAAPVATAIAPAVPVVPAAAPAPIHVAREVGSTTRASGARKNVPIMVVTS